MKKNSPKGLRSTDSSSPKKLFSRKDSRENRNDEKQPSLSTLHGAALTAALKERFPKRQWKAGVVLTPNPVVLVSCGGGKSGYQPNVATVAWAGTVNTEPAMLSISLRPSRLSHEIIMKTKEFVVNLPSVSQAKIVDWCGVKSGRDVDKFAEMKLTALKGESVTCPIVADCPVNIECKVWKVIPLGTHDLILAKVAGVQVSEEVLDKKGKLRVEVADILGFAHGEYRGLGRKVGTFGFSVKKR